MTGDADFSRIEQLFHAAADVPAAERAAHLDRECPPGLRPRVEAMLAQLDSPSLDSPVGRTPLDGSLTEGPGTVLDRYKLLQVIGEGGFGVVYMAEQLEPVQRRVALKIIKLGMDTREVIARFEAERQAVALMDHPHIAKILDAGATASGRPYFVMELVRGISITEYCEQNRLSTRARLRLFTAVCAGVQHAHQKGVIHRDLKPSNIMITMNDGKPLPKIIDFGIAKAMHTRLTEKTLFTQYDRFIGTPAYMSPEQAQLSALDVDTRTDIYALGAVLYEMLTGAPPFDVKTLLRAGLGEIQRTIREVAPPRPSQRVSTGGGTAIAGHRPQSDAARQELSRRLRGDLDWIVMKALEKERGRRYGTASELAEDIDLHLRDEPVKAGPPSGMYRLRKFLVRNRTLTAASLVAVLILLAGIVGIVLAKREADRRAADAEVALDFLADTLALTDPDVARDPQPSVRKLLDRAAEQVAPVFRGRPDGEARVRSVIGQAYKSIGANDAAERHLRRAAELIEALPDFDGAERWTVLWALTNVAFRQDRNDSFAVANRALRAGAAHVGASGDVELGRRLDAFNRTFEQQQLDRAMPLFDSIRERAASVLAADSPLWLIVADTYKAAGYSVWYSPNEGLARTFWTEALAVKRRHLPANHPDIGETLTLLVGVLHRAGAIDEAERYIRESIALLREVYPEGHWQTALAQSSLAENLIMRGRYAAAEELLLPAHAVVLAVWDESNYNAMEVIARVITLYEGWGRPEAAAPYRASIARTCAHYKWLMPWPQIRLVFTAEHGELRALLDALDRLCGGLRYNAGPTDVDSVAAVDTALRVCRLRRERIGADDPLAATLARALLMWEDGMKPGPTDEARLAMVDEAAVILQAWPELKLERAEALAKLAALRVAEDPAASRAMAQQSLALLAELRPDAWIGAVRWIVIGKLLTGLGLHADAERVLLAAHDTLVAQMGPNQEPVHQARAALRTLFEARGQPDRTRAYAPADPDGG